MSVIKSAIVVLAVSLALGIVACTTKPILNVNNSSISTKTGKALEVAQVRQAILTAGVGLGWKLVDVKPGLMEGTLRLREHTATVDIPYSTSSYSILFKSGVNLSEKDGQIHKNYNSWVSNLDKAIGAELTRM